MNQKGEELFRAGEQEECILEFRKAVEFAPTSSYFHYNLGTSYLFRNEYASALEALKESVRLDSMSAIAHNNLGVVLEKLGYFEEAFSHYKQASQLAPGNLEAQRNRDLLRAFQARLAPQKSEGK